MQSPPANSSGYLHLFTGAGVIVVIVLALAGAGAQTGTHLLWTSAALLALAIVMVLAFGPAPGDVIAMGTAVVLTAWTWLTVDHVTPQASHWLAIMVGTAAIWLVMTRIGVRTWSRERASGWLALAGLAICIGLNTGWLGGQVAGSGSFVFTVFALLSLSRLLQILRRMADAPMGIFDRAGAILRTSTASALTLLLALTGLIAQSDGPGMLLGILALTGLAALEAWHWPFRPDTLRKHPLANAAQVALFVLAGLTVWAAANNGLPNAGALAGFAGALWPAVSDHVLTGLGPGSYDLARSTAVTPATRDLLGAGTAFDMALTRWITETGLVGTLGAIAAMAGIYKVNGRPLRSRSGSVSPALAGLVLGWSALVACLIEPGHLASGTVWLVTAGLALSYGNGASSRLRGNEVLTDG